MKTLRLVLLALLLAGGAQAADRTFTGSASAPRDGDEPWHYFLILHDNTHAFFRTIRTARSSMIETGTWSINESGHIALQFLDRSGRPRGEPLVWKLVDGVLTPVSWDKAEWGDNRPPTLQRG